MISALLMMLIVGGILGAALGVAAKIFYVEVDERLEKVTEMLPGLNCGACGYPGCAGFAESLISGESTAVSICKPSKAEQREEIAKYLNETPDPSGKTLSVKPV